MTRVEAVESLVGFLKESLEKDAYDREQLKRVVRGGLSAVEAGPVDIQSLIALAVGILHLCVETVIEGSSEQPS